MNSAPPVDVIDDLHRRGLIALTHLPGHTLDTRVGPDEMRRLGACLGELHASGPTGVQPVERPPVIDYSGVALAKVRGTTTTTLRASHR